MNAVPIAQAVRCVIYTRYSTDEQNVDSTEVQIQKCTSHAEAHGWQIVEPPFSDEGISGYATGNRPAYLRMYGLAEGSGFEILLVNDTSRLARSTDWAPIIKRLKFRQVRVIGARDGYDSASRRWRRDATYDGNSSEEMIEMISIRTHDAQENIVCNKGESAGGRAYGYRCVHDLHPTLTDKSGRPQIVAKRMEIDPAAAKVVIRIFAMFTDEGLSPVAIAARLNGQGVPSPGSTWNRKVRRASGWLASTVSCILRNALYRGIYVWNRTIGLKDPDSGKLEYRRRPQDQWITQKRPELRIIDDALWERTRDRLTLRARGRGLAIAKGIQESKRKRVGGAQSRYLLGSLLVCGACRCRLTAMEKILSAPGTPPTPVTTICEYRAPSLSSRCSTISRRTCWATKRWRAHGPNWRRRCGRSSGRRKPRCGRRLVVRKCSGWMRRRRRCATRTSAHLL